MSVLQIVCQNCGAKYKLPESFQGDKAKCKACGTVIDVAAQRDATAAPPASAAAKPASAKPATARPATARPAAAKAGAAEPRRASASRRGAAADAEADGTSASKGRAGRRTRGGDEEAGGRGRRGGEKKKASPALMIGGGLLLVAVVVVGVIFAFAKKDADDKASADQTASAAGAVDKRQVPAAQGATPDPTPPAAATGGAEKPTGAPADAAASNKSDAAKAKPDDAAAKPDDAAAKPDDAAAKPDEAAAKPDAAKPEAKPNGKEATPSPAGEITSRDQVFDPKTLDPLPYPEGTSDALKAEIEGHLQEIVDMGRGRIQAKAKLEQIGYPALFGIINRLLTIDYFDSSESMTAFELNRLLETITAGNNAGYRAPQIGAQQDLKDVDFNARTTKLWITLPRAYPNLEAFQEALRKKKKAGAEGLGSDK